MSEIVLIVGASSDIGAALAQHLLASSPLVRIIAHCFSGSDQIARLRVEFGDRVYPMRVDLTDAASVERMVAKITEEFGVPTKIVYLPALRLVYDRLTKFNVERFRQDMAIQVEAPVALLKQFGAKMGKAEGARFVFVLSSVIAGMPPKFMSMYAVAKYAQLGLMRAAAAEYAATHLTVNAVSPGMVETKFLAEISETAVQMSAAANPKKRNARPEDILPAIDFLLSPGAGFITGAVIPITGGSS